MKDYVQLSKIVYEKNNLLLSGESCVCNSDKSVDIICLYG
jgi:hypothetical protein